MLKYHLKSERTIWNCITGDLIFIMLLIEGIFFFFFHFTILKKIQNILFMLFLSTFYEHFMVEKVLR